MCDLFGFLLYFLMLVLLETALIKKNNLYLFFSMVFVVFIAMNRGNSGVDTPLYILRFENIEPFMNISIIEPFIPVLMSLVKYLGGSFSSFSFLHGFIVSILYLYIFKRFPNAIYFGLAIFPVIYIDSLFNGIRIGLAYPLMFLSITYSSVVIFIFALSGHISSLLIGVFKIIPYKYIISLVSVAFIIFFLSDLTIFDLLSDRYNSKFNNYQEMYTRNIYSGIADSTLFFIAIVIYMRVLGVRGKSFIQKSLLLLILVIIFHVLLVSEYIFMLRVTRILDIAMFALIAKSNNKRDKFALYLSFIIGLLYSLNFLRQINSTCDYEVGGFIPLDFGLF